MNAEDFKHLLPQAKMSCTSQDASYHKEGDVWTHTEMVATCMDHLLQSSSLSDGDKFCLRLAAYFHDCGKALTTCEIDGVIRSPRHALKGAQFARKVLYKDSCIDPAMREVVFGLILRHGVPLTFLDADVPERRVIEASWSARADMLALLAMADVGGRICADKGELTDRISLFEATAVDLDCLTAPMEFPSDHSRFLFFNDGKERYQAYDDTKFSVTIMSGLPGAGKDYWIEANMPGAKVVSLDALRTKMGIDPSKPQGAVVARGKEMAREFMRKKQDFVWNATCISRGIRSSLVKLFRRYGAKVRMVYVEAPYAVIQKRAKVPQAVLDALASRLEVPSAVEAHEVQWIFGEKSCNPSNLLSIPALASISRPGR